MPNLTRPVKISPLNVRELRNKRHMEQTQEEGTPIKKVSFSLGACSVRKHCIVLGDIRKSKDEEKPSSDESERHSFQKSMSCNSTALNRWPLQCLLAHNIVYPDNKLAKTYFGMKHQQENTTAEKTCISPEANIKKYPLIKLVRLNTDPENKEERRSKDEYDTKHSVQKNISSSHISRDAKFLQSSTANNVLSSSKRIIPRSRWLMGQQVITPEKTDGISPERSCTQKHNVIQGDHIKIEPEKEENLSTDDSDDEQSTNKEQAGLSAYELKRLKNIQENAKFLNCLNLLESAPSLRPARKIQKKSFKEKTLSNVVRRSMRLQKLDISGAELPEKPEPIVVENPMKPPGPMMMRELIHEDSLPDLDRFLSMWSSISQETVRNPNIKQADDLRRYAANLSSLTIREEAVMKVVPSRIFSVAIHPSEVRTLVAAGDKWGHVGLWDLAYNSSENGVYAFAPHSRPVTTLSFSPSNSAHLLSASCDGTLRCGDVSCAVFDEICRDEEESFSSFDFLSADGSVLIVSHWDSQLSLVDRRTPGTSYELNVSIGMSSARTVHVHPLQRDLCVVAGMGDVCIYDVRNLCEKKTRPVLTLSGHTKSVASAYFSPITGRRLLTTCNDDRIRVYDSSSIVSEVPLLTSLRHNNQTGRWLTRFRAVWDPKQENCFVVGSMVRPRQIEVYDDSGELVHSFWDGEHLGSVCSINAMHPTRHLVVGGNSSGRMFLFQNN